MRRFIARSPSGRLENLGPAGGRKHQTHQQLEGGGLAGAVRPEESEHFAGVDLQGQAIERPVGTLAPEAERVVFGEVERGKRAHAHEPRRAPHSPRMVS